MLHRLNFPYASKHEEQLPGCVTQKELSLMARAGLGCLKALSV